MKEIKGIVERADLRYWRFFFVSLGLAAALAVFEVLLAKQTGNISQAAVDFSIADIKHIIWVMAGLTGGKLAISALHTLRQYRMMGRAAYSLRRFFTSFLLKINFKSLSLRSSGDMLSLYSRDLPQAVELLTMHTLQLISGIFSMAFSAVLMIMLHPWLTLVFFALYPPLTYLQVRISRPVQALSVEASQKAGEFNAVVNDSLQNTALVLSYGLEDAMEARYSARFQGFFESRSKASLVMARLITLGVLLSTLPLLLAYAAGAWQVVAGRLTMGQFITFTTLAGVAQEWLAMLSQNLDRIQTQRGGAKRLLAQTEEFLEPLAHVALAPDAAWQSAVSLKDVSFSYGGGTNALESISLTVQKGEHIAIVGPSGCGKSTLAKIILGLYPPDGGTVEWLEGQGGLTPVTARDHVAYVPQDSYIFPQTIRQNIVFTEAYAAGDEPRLREACARAGILQFIESLPQGFDTLMLSGGENLSGGQRQRVAIARALYRNAPILLMDEATSALDPSTEQAVLSGLYTMRGEQTLITIAHRLRAVEGCDRVIYMEKGRIAEEGTFEQLMRPGTRLYQLYQAQREEEAANDHR